jgi:hypothetical protein
LSVLVLLPHVLCSCLGPVRDVISCFCGACSLMMTMQEMGDDFVGGTTVSLLAGYVKLKGTCAACKCADRESLIEKGDFLWMKGKGQYMKKVCFLSLVDCGSFS